MSDSIHGDYDDKDVRDEHGVREKHADCVKPQCPFTADPKGEPCSEEDGCTLRSLHDTDDDCLDLTDEVKGDGASDSNILRMDELLDSYQSGVDIPPGSEEDAAS